MTTAETHAGVLPELAGISFDGVLTSCVGGWDDQARESGIRMLAAIRELVTKHFPDGTTP
jgi:myo-inositol catabolism protein IolH